MVLLHELPDINKITMATLVEKTNLTERQIRRCIAEELVDGAAGKGQGARYSRKTLRRLQLIRKLQEQKVEPLGRQLTLKEIKSTLDSLSKQQEEQILSGMAFSFIDTEAREPGSADASVEEMRLDNEYNDIHETALRGDGISHTVDDVTSRLASMHHLRRPLGITDDHVDFGEFGMLLKMLRDKLETLVKDKSALDQTTEEDTWVRVRTRSPVMEIHVKAPRTTNDRARLKAVQTAVEELIRRGYGPYYD